MSNSREIEAAKRLEVNGDFVVVMQKRIAEEIGVLLSHDPVDSKRTQETLTRYHALDELADYVKQLARETADG